MKTHTDENTYESFITILSCDMIEMSGRNATSLNARLLKAEQSSAQRKEAFENLGSRNDWEDANDFEAKESLKAAKHAAQIIENMHNEDKLNQRIFVNAIKHSIGHQSSYPSRKALLNALHQKNLKSSRNKAPSTPISRGPRIRFEDTTKKGGRKQRKRKTHHKRKTHRKHKTHRNRKQ